MIDEGKVYFRGVPKNSCTFASTSKEEVAGKHDSDLLNSVRRPEFLISHQYDILQDLSRHDANLYSPVIFHFSVYVQEFSSLSTAVRPSAQTGVPRQLSKLVGPAGRRASLAM